MSSNKLIVRSRLYLPLLILLLAVDSAALAQTARVTFSQPMSTDLGITDPADLVAADFNQDGHLDLAVTGKTNAVKRLAGTGTGLFANAPGVVFGDATGIATADFNGDGALDLAITQGLVSKSYFDAFCGSTIAVGVFAGPNMSFRTCLVSGLYPIAVQAADFDRDGRMDVAVVSRVAQGLRIFRGLGDGTFAGAIVVSSSEVNATEMAEPVDLNADGFLDLVVSHNSGVNTYLGNGDSTFRIGGTAGSSNPTQAVAVGNLNGDTVPDIASVESTSGRLVVGFGIGNGTFSTAVWTVGTDLADVVIRDIDRDGRSDIVIAHMSAGTIRIFFGNGDGTFVENPAIAISVRPKLLAVFDWDEDGDLDIGVVDASVGGQNAVAWIALQTGRGPADQTPPTVSLTSPLSNATVRGTVAIIAAASDNAGVTRVEFFVGATLIAKSGGPAFVVSWNTAGLPNGPAVLIARAFDAALNQSDSGTVQVTVDNDVTAPIISAVASSNVTSVGATITWTTNEPADSEVEYGATSSYGQTTPLNASLVTAHSVNVAGLSANMTYHFRVKSRDASNNIAISQDFTFTTLDPLTLLPATLQNATVGVPYNQSITASGAAGPYTFSIVTGVLPAGLALNPSTGGIMGTPATSGAANFTVRAVNSAGNAGYRSYTVAVADDISADISQSITSTTYDSTPSPGFVGLFVLNTTLTNDGLPVGAPIFLKLAELRKNGVDENPLQPNMLLSADNEAGVVGDIQTVSAASLGTGQSVPVSFLIGLGSRQKFTITVDLFAVLPGSAGVSMDPGIFRATAELADAGRTRFLRRFRFEIPESIDPHKFRESDFKRAHSTGNMSVIIGPGAQSGPAVAVDLNASGRIALAANDSATRTVTVTTTRDGGKTWQATPLSRTLANTNFYTAQNPSVAFDSRGRLSVVYTLSNAFDSENAIVVSESSDGINFSPPRAISHHPASDGIIDSRPVIAIDSRGDRFVAWDSFSTTTLHYSIYLAHAKEAAPFGRPTTVMSNGLVSSPSLSLSRTAIYVGWNEWGFNSRPPYNTGGRLMIAASPHAATLNFAKAHEIARTDIGFARRIGAMPEKGVGPNLMLAVDPKREHLVSAVFAAQGNGIDVRFGRSADRGKTWDLVPVIQDPMSADQFSPAIAVDSDGAVNISFYDTQGSRTFETAHLFLATSSQRKSFDVQRVSTAASDDSRKNPRRDVATNLGDRTAITMTSKTVVMAWTDTRLGDEDIFLSIISKREPKTRAGDSDPLNPLNPWLILAPLLHQKN